MFGPAPRMSAIREDIVKYMLWGWAEEEQGGKRNASWIAVENMPLYRSNIRENRALPLTKMDVLT